MLMEDFHGILLSSRQDHNHYSISYLEFPSKSFQTHYSAATRVAD